MSPLGKIAARAVEAVVLTTLLSSGALAEEADTEQAAAEFDRGVELFEQAEYEPAARAFLRADVRAPNSEAVANAITAARRANDHLLVIEAAERALEREATDPGLAAKGRQALSEAARHLARVDLECRPAPCDLFIDSMPVDDEARFVLPGTHTLTASAPEGARAEQTQNFVAGTTYRVVLHPTADQQSARAAEVTKRSHDTGGRPGKPPPADRGAEAPGPSPALFYTGVGVTAGLAATWAWSGIDTLNARDDLGDVAPKGDREKLRGKVLRTDLLLGGSIVAAAVTTYLGVRVVDWGGERETAVVPTDGGAFVVTRGRF